MIKTQFELFSLSLISQLPCSLTELIHSPNQPVSSIGSFTGFHIGSKVSIITRLLTVMVKGLSLMTMPSREKKTAARLFSSSRYSLASSGLKGDQT